MEMTLRMSYLLLAATTLGVSGCLAVAAGTAAVAGGAAGYAYYKGGVAQDYHASFPDSWNATLGALSDLGMPLVYNEAGKDSGSVESRNAANDKVTISLETTPGKVPTESPTTNISVRVG